MDRKSQVSLEALAKIGGGAFKKHRLLAALGHRRLFNDQLPFEFIEIGFGFAFELPLIVFYLVIFDVVPYKKLRGSWRTVYVVLMVVSAMATPDASPITMLLMFAALLVLYEGSLLISRIVLGKRIKKQNEELEREEAEERGA